jgi:hypothetical protein
MREDIGALIEDAADQHAALSRALTTAHATQIGFDDEQERALNAPIQSECIVCMDDVTVWATEAHRLRLIGALSAENPIPWVVSLTDLMAIVDLLDGSQLVHYILRRQRLEKDGRISAHDELDWVGHYFAEGLYFDWYFTQPDSPDFFRLATYTEPIDAWYFTREGVRSEPVPKPSQPIPEPVLRLIGWLEGSRPNGWLLGCLALLDGDDRSRDTWSVAIEHVESRSRTEGWSNASLLFSGHTGVTYYIDRRIERSAVQADVRDYIGRKVTELDQPNWIAIGKGRTGGLFVELVETDPANRLVGVYGSPDLVSVRATAAPAT